MAFALLPSATASRAAAAAASQRCASLRARPTAALSAPRRRAAAPRASYRLYTAAELRADEPAAPAAAAAPAQPAAEAAPVPSAPLAAEAPAAEAGAGTFLTAPQELMNGRAAMAGFAIAVATELSTGQGVASQVFATVTQKATLAQTHAIDATHFMAFAFVVAAVTMGSLAPAVMADGATKEAPKSPLAFMTPAAELQNCRAAMLGFVALIATEAVKGSALF